MSGFKEIHESTIAVYEIHAAGEVLGVAEGEPVYHSSLPQQEYRHILGSAGFQDIEMSLDDKTCDRTVLLARQYGRF